MRIRGKSGTEMQANDRECERYASRWKRGNADSQRGGETGIKREKSRGNANGKERKKRRNKGENE